MDSAAIEDMFFSLQPISIRRMFGGKGIYRDGIIFAIEFEGDILLKADSETAPLFAAAGSTQWGYEGKTGKTVMMPYWSLPEDALDDPEEMQRWARLAFEAGARSAKAIPTKTASKKGRKS
ncbi:TfoX/Sxy family protein [Rhizobium sp. AAP43]|uniref:TfoX/Sxy family protein n=1 Tax=Rhizobium sp. AAP43 TaxID=1523420 RepID=UPI0006B9341E|nr:TfoX/Sxy family protein [Rhizobium sp. AAP43]KPF44102.1 competence protein TfoX [Rhizobium sp. AAP43]